MPLVIDGHSGRVSAWSNPPLGRRLQSLLRDRVQHVKRPIDHYAGPRVVNSNTLCHNVMRGGNGDTVHVALTSAGGPDDLVPEDVP